MKISVESEEDRDRVISKISELDPKKKYSVEIKLYRKPRSVNQNALYWLWLTAISSETGFTTEDLHEYFKVKYLPINRRRVFDFEITKTTSTTELNTSEFNEYLDKIYVEVTQSAIAEIYYPEDVHWEKFSEYYSERL